MLLRSHKNLLTDSSRTLCTYLFLFIWYPIDKDSLLTSAVAIHKTHPITSLFGTDEAYFIYTQQSRSEKKTLALTIDEIHLHLLLGLHQQSQYFYSNFYLVF